MIGRSSATLLLALVAVVIACEGDSGVGPDEGVDRDLARPVPRPMPVPTTLVLRPAKFLLTQGTTLQLDVVARDQWQSPYGTTGIISFYSDTPAIASVSGTGLVTGISPGLATISATLSTRNTTVSATTTIQVADTVARDSVLIMLGEGGWQPNPAYVAAGGLVRWAIGLDSANVVAGEGDPSEFDEAWLMKVHVFAEGSPVVDVVTVGGHSTTRRFPEPTTVRYCPDGCSDPVLAGVIRVR